MHTVPESEYSRSLQEKYTGKLGTSVIANEVIKRETSSKKKILQSSKLKSQTHGNYILIHISRIYIPYTHLVYTSRIHIPYTHTLSEVLAATRKTVITSILLSI